MKAITILEPWASLIACSAKQVETILEILALRKFVLQLPKQIPVHYGAVIAIAELVDCLKVIDWTIGDELRVISATLEDGQIVTGNELEFGDYAPGRYAWMLENVQAIKPIKVKGKQRLWEWAG